VAEEEKKQKISDLSPAGKIRLATLGNAFARAVLIRDTNKLVSMAAIRSPAVTDMEVMRYASNRGLDDEIIRFIANRRQWVRLNSVKLALCNNPKCPLPIAMRRGAVIEYWLRVRGVPIHWKTLITDLRAGHSFTDVQLRGPYELWRHRHEFEPSGGCMQMRDRLEFSLPLAPLGNVALPMVGADVEKSFVYRQPRIAELLSGERS